jgi:hypothetical protein
MLPATRQLREFRWHGSPKKQTVPVHHGKFLLKESTTRSLEIGHMQPVCRAITALILVLFANSAFAQKQGGTLRVYHRDSPASMSIYEETTVSTAIPMMGVFNNLVDFDPNQAQNRLDNIAPDLAESWAWNVEGTELTFKLRSGVKWHDGQPFTANDVKCSWDLLLGKANEKLRVNPREAWWINLNEVTVENDHQNTFRWDHRRPAQAMSYSRSGASCTRPVSACRAQFQTFGEDLSARAWLVSDHLANGQLRRCAQRTNMARAADDNARGLEQTCACPK